MTRSCRAAARACALPLLALVVASCAAGTAVVAPGKAKPPPATPAATPTPAVAKPVPVQPLAAVSVPERADARPPLVRVLLQASAGAVFPEPGRRYVCVAGAQPVLLRGALSAQAVPGRPGVQVGAFALEANAQAAIAKLSAEGFAASVTGGGAELRRVVVHADPGEDAETLAGRLRRAGFADLRPAAPVAAAVVVEGEGATAVRGALVRVVPIDRDPVRLGAKALRGEFEIRAGAGGVAVVNVVNLEEYLRGVVPAEMGPRAFPLLEALKAQAVAARTYAVAHLGDHAAEGYDLCDSQLCQVYEGAGAEQPLSDRAVAETAGGIATWHGKPIDAMYHSTCAGHTEDAEAVFPQRAAPYLKGVRCRGERILAGGAGGAGPWLGETARLAAVGVRLAGALGAPPQAGALASRLTGVAPAPGVAGLVRAFGFADTAGTLHIAGGAGPEETALELLRVFRLPLAPPPRGAGRGEWETALVVRLGQLAGTVQAVGGRLAPGPSGIRLIADGAETSKDLNGREALLERRGARWRLRSLEFPAGSPATLWCAGGACPVLEVEPLEDADAGSAWTWWVREMSLVEIGRRIGVAGVSAVAVARRGVSGRALAVTVTGAGGATEVPGLHFRRALDLPDTLFAVAAARGAATPSLRFLGRGWGHGIGMCQNGAYGLARGGASHAEILKTYYTGIELSQWEGGDHERKGEAGK